MSMALVVMTPLAVVLIFTNGGSGRPCNLHPLKHVLVTPSVAPHSVNLGARLTVTNSWNPLGSVSVHGGTATRSAKLGNKWIEYQGSNNWEGLLDPLDDDLRSEILRYGGFVDAAYRAFDFDTASPRYATCRFSRNSMLSECGLGESGYKLTKNLRATCGIQLPRWIDNAPSWVSNRSSWIGYVAVCVDKEEIARLGRRDVMIAYRGTATCLEWLENLRASLTCLHDDDGSSKCLGSALATLTAYDIATTFDHAPSVTVFSFGGPRVGNQSFRCQLDKCGTRILRIVNSDDVITKVPGFLAIDNNDIAARRTVEGLRLPSWFQKLVKDTKWAYADVGKELRLSSRESPYLTKGDIATCHDLKTYLHLVNGFVSSTCPFRATAKRLLNRS
ncbi:hypothetical protein F0562_014693 [Nyssa sinensis]|uniref:Fungal lipase-type domain-containing protein n=1 Tax=Nyssa sinensis TaxID=561372 RepID=A0A5J4ZTE4_9ASTE|nr:hypothetical protein F0562_014693 [Nyssa sinensis]